MRAPTKNTPSSNFPSVSDAVLLALPFPACIFDSVSGIVFYSNNYFKQANAISLIDLLRNNGYNFLSDNDLKIITHRIKFENKITTRRLFFVNGNVKSIELNLSVIPGQNLVLFFFNEVWTQETIFSKSGYMEELIQGITEGVAIIDEKDTLTFCNRAFAKFLGKIDEEIMGSNITKVFNALDVNVVEKLNQLKELKDTSFEIKINSLKNKHQVILVHALVRSDAVGKYSGAFFTLMDITDRVEMEKELIFNKEKALESDRLKTSFLTNMSHEIRTPMNCIIGFSALLKKKGLDWRKREQYLDIIISRGKHLMDILNNIIDISKLEENQIQLNYENCNLAQLFGEIKEYHEMELIRNKKDFINIELNIPSELQQLQLNTDVGRLHQILTNLMDNALKFTESGTIELGFSTSPTNEIILYVKDSGIGIPSDKQQIIFERFRQADESFTRCYGGTGLGLALCKGFLDLLGGRIWVDSDGLNGSTFSFTLPVVKENNFEIKESTDSTSNTDDIDFNWTNKTILIIEDDHSSFEYISEVLLPTNCNIIHADNGKAAIDLISTISFDLVLLDIQLPEVDGLHIANLIRKSNSNVPIIAQTAHAMSDDKQKCLNAGCSEYLTKPVHFENLLETISRFLKN